MNEAVCINIIKLIIEARLWIFIALIVLVFALFIFTVIVCSGLAVRIEVLEKKIKEVDEDNEPCSCGYEDVVCGECGEKR